MSTRSTNGLILFSSTRKVCWKKSLFIDMYNMDPFNISGLNLPLGHQSPLALFRVNSTQAFVSSAPKLYSCLISSPLSTQVLQLTHFQLYTHPTGSQPLHHTHQLVWLNTCWWSLTAICTCSRSSCWWHSHKDHQNEEFFLKVLYLVLLWDAPNQYLHTYLQSQS